MHRSGRKEGEMGDKSSVVLLQQEFSPSVRTTEPFLIHLKQASSEHLTGPSWGSLSCSLIPGPQRTRPLWPWGAAPGKALPPEPRAPGLELLESWGWCNPLATIGHAAVTLPGWASGAFCIPRFEECHVQTQWKGKHFPCQETATASLGHSVGCKNRKHSLVVEMPSFFRPFSSSSYNVFSKSYLNLSHCSSSLFLLFQSAKS